MDFIVLCKETFFWERLFPLSALVNKHTYTYTQFHTNCHVYRLGKWERRCEFKFWMRMFVFQLTPMSLKKKNQPIFFLPPSMPPNRLGLWNTLTTSLQRGDTFLMSVIDMTINNLIVRIQSESPWESRVHLLLPLLPGPPRHGVGAPDRILSLDQIELFDIQSVCKQMTNAKLNC